MRDRQEANGNPAHQHPETHRLDPQRPDPRQPDLRRLGPRPLPLHLSLSLASWSNSALVLPSLNIVWQHLKEQAAGNAPAAGPNPRPPSLPVPPNLAQALREIGPQLDAADPAALARALNDEGHRRLQDFLTGVLAYRSNPPPPRRDRPLLWQQGSTRLLDYRSSTPARPDAPRILVVPSLVNRYYILDLDPTASFLDYLAQAGLQPFVVDWGKPGATESAFTLSDYIAGRLIQAYDMVRQQPGGPIILVGYCMGGVLALALPQLIATGAGTRANAGAADLAGLVLLATPWDFHAGQAGQAQLLAALGHALEPLMQVLGELPVDVLQCLFSVLDPFQVPRKFQHFATLDPANAKDQVAAGRFTLLEDWLNDGVPLAPKVARECLLSWYGDNATMRKTWQVGGTAIDPAGLHLPSLAMIPANDRIVPPESALALSRSLPNVVVDKPAAGHIGMMAGSRAAQTIWPRIVDWIAGVAAGHQNVA